MPMTTFLHESELNQPTGDSELDELLASARIATGDNYQIVVHRVEVPSRIPFRWRREERPQLYVEVPGVGPWQVMTCSYNRETIAAFLLGLLNGADHSGEAGR